MSHINIDDSGITDVYFFFLRVCQLVGFIAVLLMQVGIFHTHFDLKGFSSFLLSNSRFLFIYQSATIKD